MSLYFRLQEHRTLSPLVAAVCLTQYHTVQLFRWVLKQKAVQSYGWIHSNRMALWPKETKWDAERVLASAGRVKGNVWYCAQHFNWFVEIGADHHLLRWWTSFGECREKIGCRKPPTRKHWKSWGCLGWEGCGEYSIVFTWLIMQEWRSFSFIKEDQTGP